MAYENACLTSVLLYGGRRVLKPTRESPSLVCSSSGNQGTDLPSVSMGKTSFPGRGVGEGVSVTVGGKGDGVNVAVAGRGEDVIVGAGDAVGTIGGSAKQPVMKMSRRINVMWRFIMSLLVSLCFSINQSRVFFSQTIAFISNKSLVLHNQ